MTTLDKVKRGQEVEIRRIPDDKVRAQAIRFGVCEGTVVFCTEKMPAGPVVISKGHQELAIGRELAKKITVVVRSEKIEQTLPQFSRSN